MKKIQIITLDMTLIGGAERVISNLANYFIKDNKYEVEVISLFKKNKDIFYVMDKSIKIKYLIEDEFDISTIKLRIKNYFNASRELLNYMNNTDGDIVISMFTNINIFLSIFRNKINKIIIGTEHAQYDAPNMLVKLLRRILYRNLNNVVVLNTTDLDKFRRYMGSKVKLIPNPLTFQPKQHSKLDNKIILAAGRLTHVKGFDYLIEIFKKVNLLYPEWRLVIAGDGELKDELIKRIELLEIKNSVELIPFQKNIDKLFLKSSIFCMTSRQECFPMVLLEAMAFGLPVISYNVPNGPKDIIKDNEDGYLVSPFNIEEYVEKLASLIEDSKKREFMGNNAYKNIERYSIENISKEWEKLF